MISFTQRAGNLSSHLGGGHFLNLHAATTELLIIIPHHQPFGIGCTDPDAKSLLSLPSSRRVTRTDARGNAEHTPLSSSRACTYLCTYLRLTTGFMSLYMRSSPISFYSGVLGCICICIYASWWPGPQFREADHYTIACRSVNRLQGKSAT
jgi:hypothetical protein